MPEVQKRQFQRRKSTGNNEAYDMNGESAIIAHLNDLKGRVDRLSRKQTAEGTETRARIGILREDVAGLKVKSGIWGAIGGMVPVAITIAYFLLKEATGK